MPSGPYPAWRRGHPETPRWREGSSSQSHTIPGPWSTASPAPLLTPSVCAMHAVVLRGESPLSRCAWNRRTREAQGRHREVRSEGRVERTCGARDTNRKRGVVPSGRAGTRAMKSSIHKLTVLYRTRAPMHGRRTADRRRSAVCPGVGLRAEDSPLTAPQKSVKGIVDARGAC